MLGVRPSWLFMVCGNTLESCPSHLNRPTLITFHCVRLTVYNVKSNTGNEANQNAYFSPKLTVTVKTHRKIHALPWTCKVDNSPVEIPSANLLNVLVYIVNKLV
jgi:hypothetical protein